MKSSSISDRRPLYNSPLAGQILRFLQIKRALGCRYRDEERSLGVLDRFLAARLSPSDPLITNEIIHT